MHRKKSVLELQTRHRGICLQSIMENSGISQKLKCKYEMQQHVNNNVAKNRVFQSLSTHGWMSIEHWRQFFIAKSINFCFCRKHFIHSCSPKMCITPEKSQNCVWKATEKARRASRYDFKQSKPFIATLGNF